MMRMNPIGRLRWPVRAGVFGLVLMGAGALLHADSTVEPGVRSDPAMDLAGEPHWLLSRQEVQSWLQTQSETSGLERAQLERWLAGAQHQPEIVQAMQRPAERVLEWADYRRLFITDQRVSEGQAFMREHADTLQRAQAEFGVPAGIITAIIGVETFYGRLKGRWSVLDALATLGFDYPPRATFFRNELAEFLRLADKERWDVPQIKGSYAGAMGIPQFIASSYREYAIDFDADGRRDLFDNPVDAIGSVANYLKRHGWKSGQPIVEPLPEMAPRMAVNSQRLEALWTSELKPVLDPGKLRALGAPVRGDQPVRLLRLQGDSTPDWWVSYENFYAITRYNHSELYAMAVFTLHQALLRNG